MSNRIALTAAAALAASAFLPASAAGTAAFRFQRGELATDAGASRVIERMSVAAARACAVASTGTRLMRVDGDCKARLLDDWVRQSGDETLTRLHHAR